MLKFFGSGKPDHPMADPKEARRILDELPALDAAKALEELSHWHESVAAAEGFKPADRLQLHLAIDEAAQARARKLSRDYLAAERPTRFQENRLWSHSHEYWRQAAQAFSGVLNAAAGGEDLPKGMLGLLLVRTLRSLAQQLKWQHLRYGPIEPATWGMLNAAYAFAEQRSLVDAPSVLYASAPGESTPRQEFLKAVMFSASSPDSLLPLQADIVERLIAEFAGQFEIAAAPAAQLSYWTDLAKPMAPLRVVQPPARCDGLRCFGPGAALAALRDLIERIRNTGQVPAAINLGGSYAPELALEVMRHLAMYWSPEAPERQHTRHSVKSQLTVAHGLDGVLAALGGPGGALDFEQHDEVWIVENVSAGGFGAKVPQLKSDWLRVGSLLAMQPEGGRNWVIGVVRRLTKLPGHEARVGIQSLSRAPRAAAFTIRGIGQEPGVLLGPPGPAGEITIALPAGVYAGETLEAALDGGKQVYMPAGLSERGPDYDIARFREMVREA